MSTIMLSPKHAVNPSVQICFYCHRDIGVALMGHVNKRKAESLFGKEFVKNEIKHGNNEHDLEAPRKVVLDFEPCEGCEVFYPNAKLGCFLIEADEREVEVRRGTFEKVPAPTGRFVVVKDEAIKRMFSPKTTVRDILKKRIALVDSSAWAELSLPRDDAPSMG